MANSYFCTMQMVYSELEQGIFQLVAAAAREQGVQAFVIGGFVRDKILGRPTKDADIVTTGDGIELAQAVADQLTPRPPVSVFKTYGTAHFRYADMDVEFVGARKESYRPESRNPDIEPGTLEDDQLRRDFSINALAVSLNEHDYGALVDPFQGVDDIDKGIIRTPLEPGRTFSAWPTILA